MYKYAYIFDLINFTAIKSELILAAFVPIYLILFHSAELCSNPSLSLSLFLSLLHPSLSLSLTHYIYIKTEYHSSWDIIERVQP